MVNSIKPLVFFFIAFIYLPLVAQTPKQILKLDDLILRRQLIFPDGSVQSTAAITTGGTIVYAQNIGTGYQWFKDSLNRNLRFRTLVLGSGKLSGVSNANDITIDVVESNLTLSNIGGSVTDAQVPNSITLDNLTQITTRNHSDLSGLLVTASGHTMNTAKLLGRTTAGTGTVEEITAGTGLSLSSGSLSVANNTTTQRIEVVKNSGAVVGTRKQLNFIEGANTTLTVADDAANDQIDITIASGGGGTAHVVVRKSADETVTSTTLQDDDELKWNVGANESWVFDILLYGVTDYFLDGNYIDTGLLVALNAPTGTTLFMQLSHGSAFTAPYGVFQNEDPVYGIMKIYTPITTLNSGQNVNTGSAPSGTYAYHTIRLSGTIKTATTSGVAVLRWCKFKPSGRSATIKAGSYLVAHKI